jgi:hypothetical protein
MKASVVVLAAAVPAPARVPASRASSARYISTFGIVVFRDINICKEIQKSATKISANFCPDFSLCFQHPFFHHTIETLSVHLPLLILFRHLAISFSFCAPPAGLWPQFVRALLCAPVLGRFVPQHGSVLWRRVQDDAAARADQHGAPLLHVLPDQLRMFSTSHCNSIRLVSWFCG